MKRTEFKRFLKYIVVTALMAYILLIIGIKEAYLDRGYFAFGGEIFIPFLVALISAAIYNRTELIKSFLPEEDSEEEETEEEEC